MEFRILLFGPVELRAGERRGASVSAKGRHVLAALAWDAGRAVHVDTLIRRVWDGTSPAGARGNLHTLVSRIRKAMRDLGGPEAPSLTGRAHAYTLEADPGTVDVRRYLDLVGRARARAESGDPHGALRLLDEASGLWRSEPLTGVYGLWAEQVRGELARGSSAATVLRAGIDLRLGRYADAVPPLSALVERNPLDESLVELLALALYGSGRTAEATRLLHRARHRLVQDLGVEVGERLHRVQQGIVNRIPPAELLPPAGPAVVVPERVPRPDHPPPDNLPPDIPWVGRRDEIDRIVAAATTAVGPASRVVALEAIDGMAGVGKTSLAVHVAHRLSTHFPDGRVHLALRGYDPDREPRGPQDALAELLRLFGVPADRLPRTLEELTARWRTLMADRRAVVILDDAAGPEQVRPLLPGASPSLVLITGRRRLTGLAGVRTLSLDVLPEPDAIELFRRRVGPERAPRDEEIAEVVRLCGHLPLAVDIVASRFLARSSWTAADLVERLAGGGRLTEIRDAHRGITGIFEFSYRSLTPVQRRVFRLSSLHTGAEFGLCAAAALAGLSVEETDRVLEDLLNCHLLIEPSPHRYRMHDLLREYARTVVVAEEGRQAVQRLLDHYLYTADIADRVVYPHRTRMEIENGRWNTASARPAEAPDLRKWFVVEEANLLATLEYVGAHRSPGEFAIFSHVLAGFLETEGHWGVAEPPLRRAVEHWSALGDREAEAHALLDLGAVYIRTGVYEAAVECTERAARIGREIDAPEVEAEALHQFGITFWHSGRYMQALPHQQRVLAIRTRGRDRLQQARSLNAMGITLLHLGELEKSLECFQGAVSGFRSTGDLRGLYRALNNVGEAYRGMGETELAGKSYGEAFEVSLTAGNSIDRATLRMNLASIAQGSGSARDAYILYQEALSVFRGMGDKRNEAIAHNGIGGALRLMGRGEEAVSRHRTALDLARRIGAVNEEIQALRELALVEGDMGLEQQAADHLEAGLVLARRIHASAEEAETLRALAVLRTRRESNAVAKRRREGGLPGGGGRPVEGASEKGNRGVK
ncbi:AfsR/SARP family transcriptional regulator [Streptomyces megasporus]|uniref:AfsR/SARP family transcriptional regulator n=1 Tax=Streptomyces megasporus TaxID=44060 RepID=UPI00068EAF49|nr:tetratricopeptide repeat protein [Streptomyces megasporus]